MALADAEERSGYMIIFALDLIKNGVFGLYSSCLHTYFKCNLNYAPPPPIIDE